MTAVAGLYSFFTSASRSGLMSHRCNLSTKAVRDSVSARKPPIHPTPITAASTVFTGRFLVVLKLAARLAYGSDLRKAARHAEHLRRELRIDLGQHRRDGRAHQAQRLR